MFENILKNACSACDRSEGVKGSDIERTNWYSYSGESTKYSSPQFENRSKNIDELIQLDIKAIANYIKKRDAQYLESGTWDGPNFGTMPVEQSAVVVGAGDDSELDMLFGEATGDGGEGTGDGGAGTGITEPILLPGTDESGRSLIEVELISGEFPTGKDELHVDSISSMSKEMKDQWNAWAKPIVTQLRVTLDWSYLLSGPTYVSHKNSEDLEKRNDLMQYYNGISESLQAVGIWVDNFDQLAAGLHHIKSVGGQEEIRDDAQWMDFFVVPMRDFGWRLVSEK